MSKQTSKEYWGKCPTCGKEQWWSAFQPFLKTADEMWEGIALNNFRMTTGQVCHDTVSERRWLAVNPTKKEQNDVQAHIQTPVYLAEFSYGHRAYSYWWFFNPIGAS